MPPSLVVYVAKCNDTLDLHRQWWLIHSRSHEHFEHYQTITLDLLLWWLFFCCAPRHTIIIPGVERESQTEHVTSMTITVMTMPLRIALAIQRARMCDSFSSWAFVTLWQNQTREFIAISILWCIRLLHIEWIVAHFSDLSRRYIYKSVVCAHLELTSIVRYLW